MRVRLPRLGLALWIVTVFATTVLAMGLTGCAPATPRPTPPLEQAPTGADGVPFRTLAQAAPLGDHPADPAYAVMVKPDATPGLEATFPTKALETAETAVQDDGTLALLAFGGAKATSGYRITIERIRPDGEQLVVTVVEHGPGEDNKVEPAMTLPYHVVAVAREAVSNAVTHVVFEDGSGHALGREAYPMP